MTPGARVAAAIAVLDAIRAGAAAEQALTGWARSSRYAGSKDRAAVRDHVFDVLRARRSLGDGDGRSLMIQLALREGWDVDALFSGEGHAPAAASPQERAKPDLPTDAAACDLPDWLWPEWLESLGPKARAVAEVLQTRAPVFLRVNTRRANRQDAAAMLADDGIVTVPHRQVATCLEVTENPRRIKTSAAYLDGVVELQDAASQWAVGLLPLQAAATVLDFCAGGGGKALAIADLSDAAIYAHDIAPQRMRDLPERAGRAGVDVKILTPDAVRRQAPFDLVFCDAPCSGAGTWRRTPDAKWQMAPERLASLMQSQDEVLTAAMSLVAPGGALAYATCSVLQCENSERIQAFLDRTPGWVVVQQETRLPDAAGDGFYLAILKNNL